MSMSCEYRWGGASSRFMFARSPVTSRTCRRAVDRQGSGSRSLWSHPSGLQLQHAGVSGLNSWPLTLSQYWMTLSGSVTVPSDECGEEMASLLLAISPHLQQQIAMQR